jgi:hypothetical protein
MCFTFDNKMNYLLLPLAVIGLLVSSCKPGGGGSGSSKYSSARDYIDKYVPPTATKTTGSDDHGGFVGDGRLWEVYELPSSEIDSLSAALAKDPEWHALPLSEDLKKLSFAYHGDLPVDAEEGYYFFYDFQPEWYPDYPSNKDPVWDRSSVNFVIMIYVPSEGKIYVDNLDT